MEVDDLSAVPWQLIVGFLCFLLALLFWYVWPKTKAKPYSKRLSWPGFVLHYFHPLAWLLIGMAVFYMERLPAFAAILGLLGATAYIIFIVIFTKA